MMKSSVMTVDYLESTSETEYSSHTFFLLESLDDLSVVKDQLTCYLQKMGCQQWQRIVTLWTSHLEERLQMNISTQLYAGAIRII